LRWGQQDHPGQALGPGAILVLCEAHQVRVLMHPHAGEVQWSGLSGVGSELRAGAKTSVGVIGVQTQADLTAQPVGSTDRSDPHQGLIADGGGLVVQPGHLGLVEEGFVTETPAATPPLRGSGRSACTWWSATVDIDDIDPDGPVRRLRALDVPSW